MALRDINTDLKNWLLEGNSFHYAHLVKFEKPIKTSSSISARNPTDYVYITDGSLDISFNDGSVNSEGISNGSQTYRANKLLSVGAISETIEARATSMNLQVSAGALSIEIEDTFTITASSLEGSEDLVAAGFREGDTVILTQAGANNNKEIRIDKFENNNKKVIVTPINTSLSQGSESLTLKFKNPEVEGILINREDSSYARYINRDVFIYKAHINPETGTIIGTPYLIFKGIIAGGKLTEDPSRSSVVSWTLTSHWGDFSRVQGRLTSDAYHRALDQNNIPDPEATIRPEYAGDLGFLHSEQAINLVAIYQVMETKYRMKKKSSFFGLKKSYSMEEYQVQVDREADLRFNLEARYLPVVYGVNKIDSIPVFVDTLNSDSKKVFVAYALCEGQIAGLYDIYFDDTSSICIDENDSETRSSQTSENTIDVLCQGRADRGDTLTGNEVNSSTATVFNGSLFTYGGQSWSAEQIREAFAVDGTSWVPVGFRDTEGGATSFGAGITHEKGTRFQTPIDARLQFHAGKPNQATSPIISSNANDFKVATDYYSGTDPYWGANHRLLDTAYVVAEYEIGEGETTIPSLEFVVRGKGIDCFNYDFSYAQDPAFDEDPSVFNIGDSVQVKEVGTNTLIGTSTIADIYSIVNIDGNSETRIRFTEDPGLASTTNFYITSGANSFTLVTYDHIASEGQVPSELKEVITSVVPNSTLGVDLTLEEINANVAAALENGQTFSIFGANALTGFSIEALNTFIASYNNGTLEQVGTTTTDSQELVNKYVVVADGIQLANGASNTDDAYNNYEIELTQYNSNGTTTVQKRIIIDYDGATRVATVDAPWTVTPHQNDKYKIFSTTDDVRVSTNPALQTLDYLRSERYGRNLDLTQDLDKESFLEAARACDSRSNVTMITAAQPSIGDVYEFKPSATRFFQGKVKTVTSVTIDSSTRYIVEFEEVLGKLGIRWENWKYFYANELFYNNGELRSANSDNPITVFNDSGTSSIVTSLALTKRTGSGPTSLTIDVTSSTFDGNPIVKSYNPTSKSYSSGYSLYDSDDVKYWRYLGWEAQNQRHVTRHQTNSVVDTSRSIFDNINGLLGHFNGMLRYSAGKYSLAVKTRAGARTTVDVNGTTYTVDKITEDDIIGSINIEDAGQKGTYNQVDVTINDPQNRFEGRSVMMFNSNYLKEDRMIPKKGSVRTPYVTNYYNARINAKQYLEESRAGLKVNFTIAPKGVLLRAGDIIQIEYPRFGWYSNSEKYFRIINLNISDNCLIQVTAEEHSEEAFLIAATNKGQINPVEGTTAAPAAPTPPTELNATQTSENDVKTGAIEISWQNSTTFKAAYYSTEIWGSTSNNRNEATLLGTTKAQRYIDAIPDQGLLNKFYWVRHVATVPPQTGSQVGFKQIFSSYEPLNSTDGVLGTIDDGRNIVLDIDNDAATVGGIEGENVTGFEESVTATVFAGSADDTQNWSLTWNDTTVGTTGTSVVGTANGATYTVTGLNNGSEEGQEFTFADIVVTAERAGYTTRQKRFTITKILNGKNGVVYKIIPSANTVRFDPNIGVSGAYEGGTGDFNNKVSFSFVQIQNGQSTPFFGKYSLNGGDLTPGVGSDPVSETLLTTELTNGGTESVTCRLYGDNLQQLFDTSEVPLIKQGLSSRQLIISTNAQNFIKAKNGAFSPTSIALTAKKLGGITGTVAWAGPAPGTTFYANSDLTGPTAVGDIVYIAPSSVASGSITVTATVTDSLTTLEFSDSEEIGLLEEGSDTITISLTNDSVEVPTDSSGNTPDFGNTSTNISVYEGSTALTYDKNNTLSDGALGNSTFTLEIAPNGVSAPPPSGYSGNGTISPASGTITAMGGNQGSITFIARAKRANGSVVTGISKVQTFSKIRAGANGATARGLTLSSDHQVFVKDVDSNKSPSSITFTANRQNIPSGTVSFSTSPTVTIGTSGDTATLTAANFGNNTSVEVTASVTYDSVTYTDTESIELVTDGATGADAIVVSLTNDNHTFPADSSGVVSSYSGSGTNIAVYEGATKLNYNGSGTSNGTWTVSRTNSAGVSSPSTFTDLGTDASHGDRTSFSTSYDSGSVTFNISGKTSDGTPFTGSKAQTLSKAKQGIQGTSTTGDPGEDAPRIATGFVYSLQNSIAPGASVTASYSFSGTPGFTSINSNWSETPPTFSSANNVIYYAKYTAVEEVVNGAPQGYSNEGSGLSFGGIGVGTSFTGLVTFQSGYPYVDGSVTSINGGAIVADTITATQLEISNSTGASSAGINMNYNNGQPKIEISDGTNIRVTLGYLN